jgi:hypothetical protein
VFLVWDSMGGLAFIAKRSGRRSCGWIFIWLENYAWSMALLWDKCEIDRVARNELTYIVGALDYNHLLLFI